MDSLERLAASRRQVLTTVELLEAGYSDADVRRLARQGRLVRLVRGVYAVPPLEERIEIAVARGVARLHPLGAVSCEYALAVHGCPIPFPNRVHVLRTEAQRSVDGYDVRLHRTSSPVDIVVVDGISVVHPATAVIGAWMDLSTLDDRRAVVCAAVVGGTTTASAVRARRSTRQRLPHAKELDRACDLVESGCESPPEMDYLLSVEVGHRLPPAERQVWIALPDGRRRRIDAAYRRERVLIEIDGAQHWLDDAVRQADVVNDAALRAMGFVVLRFTWRDIRQRPAWVAAQVRRALALAA